MGEGGGTARTTALSLILHTNERAVWITASRAVRGACGMSRQREPDDFMRLHSR